MSRDIKRMLCPLGHRGCHMRVNKVIIDGNSSFFDGLEISGYCTKNETKILERKMRNHAFTLWIIGKKFTDINNYHCFLSFVSDARIRYTNNGNKSLDFHLFYDGIRTKMFFNSFQRTFGKMPEAKIQYD